MSKNPLHITYSGLIRTIERRLKYMEKEYPSKVFLGLMTPDFMRTELEYYRQLVKMLKAHKKNKQLNLEDLFNK
jgi:hypothetical protein